MAKKKRYRHRTAAHGSDSPHNPWSVHCIRNVGNEPTCPDAYCWTCDAKNGEQ